MRACALIGISSCCLNSSALKYNAPIIKLAHAAFQTLPSHRCLLQAQGVASPTTRGSSDAVISGRASEADEQYEVNADEYEDDGEGEYE